MWLPIATCLAATNGCPLQPVGQLQMAAHCGIAANACPSWPATTPHPLHRGQPDSAPEEVSMCHFQRVQEPPAEPVLNPFGCEKVCICLYERVQDGCHVQGLVGCAPPPSTPRCCLPASAAKWAAAAHKTLHMAPVLNPFVETNTDLLAAKRVRRGAPEPVENDT